MIQILVMVVIGAALWIFSSPRKTLSFEWGALIVLGNFALLALAWGLIFRKKLIALAVPIIVIKYAILGIIIYDSLKWPQLDALWLCLGLASFVLTSLIYAQRQNGI